jgi:hypothetical protein
LRPNRLCQLSRQQHAGPLRLTAASGEWRAAAEPARHVRLSDRGALVRHKRRARFRDGWFGEHRELRSGSGFADVNTPSGVVEEIPVTVAIEYPSNADGVETLILHSRLGTQTFTLFLDSTSQSTQVTSQNARLVETDGQAFSSGEVSLQSNGEATQEGVYVLSGAGESACQPASCAAATPVLSPEPGPDQHRILHGFHYEPGHCWRFGGSVVYGACDV